MHKFTLPVLVALFPALLTAGNPVRSHLGFRENKGQVAFVNGKPASQVLFTTTGTAPGIFITTAGITYVFSEKTGDDATQKVNWSKVEMQMQGASIKQVNVHTEDPLPGAANFYYAHCPQGILNVKTWQKVTISEVYPCIDWVLNANDEKGLSYDFIVHPGADASKINVQYKGAGSISIMENTSIVLRSKYGSITEGALNVYEQGGKKVEASFKIDGTQVSYSIGQYDPRYDLIIDPPLQWSVKEISSGLDYANALVCPRDGTGDVIVTGFTGATDFPTLNAYQGTNGGNNDMCILRLDGTGTLKWSTYYGGSNDEEGKGIGTDVNGNCYVGGYTASTNFPVASGVSASNQGLKDVALVKLNNAGVRQWASYYGGTSNDVANAVVCDPAGNMYLTGYTGSTGFPVLNPIQATKNIANDAFVMKLNNACTVQWATFYGGDDEDKGRGITLDPSATNVYLTGTTIGQFSVTAGAFQNTNASLYNMEDIFVSKMSASNAAIQYATLCGTSDADIAEDIAVDNSGNAYIVGYTFAADYPIFNPGSGAFVDSTQGSPATHDAIVTKFNSTGTAALWSTYLGGSGVDMALGICYDPAFGVYVTGATASTDFPTQLPADNVYYQSTQGDGGSFYDGFVCWFTTAGVMEWGTYLGGLNSEEGRGIDTDTQNSIFVGGTDSNNVRVTKFAAGVLTGVASINKEETDLTLYPVPAQNDLTIILDMKQAGTVGVQVLDMQGRVLRKEIMQGAAGKNSFPLDVSQLPSGNYLLKFDDRDKNVVRKFSKQ